MLTKIFRILSKSISFLYFFLYFFNFKLAYVFAFNHFSFRLVHLLEVKNNFLIGKLTGNRIPTHIVHKFSEELPALVAILNHKKVTIQSPIEDGFRMQFNDVEMNVFSVANLVTVQEIFIDQLYQIYMPVGGVTVIDIGMNVGLASLFFAKLPFVEKVIAYEPFPATYNEAIQNLDLNSELSSKIVAYNAGISNFEGTVKVANAESGSAVANIHNELASSDSQQDETTLTIKKITEVIDDAFPASSTTKLVLKIDCEGEEYVIMNLLVSSGYINKPSLFILEWHEKGPDELLQQLQTAQFTTFHLPKPDYKSGMIYAVK